MKKFIRLIASAVVFTATVFSALVASACAEKNSDPYTITVGASITPHAEILTDVVKQQLAKYGYNLNVVEYTDYVLPNTALEQGELDANYFQHNLYLEDFNANRGTHLEAAAQIHYEPFAVYRGSYMKGLLSDIPDGSKIGVPNDGTNESRALLLLQKEGLIELKQGVTASAVTKLDIISNPKNLEIFELEAAQLTVSLPDLAVAVINGNYALSGGLQLEDALAYEEATDENVRQYINVIAVKAGNVDNPKIRALITVMLGNEVREYIQRKFENAVVPVF